MVKRRGKRMAVVVAVLALVALGACVLLLGGFQVCRDWAFICRNTGSRKGHREWFLGVETGHWREQSELERFMAANHPTEFQHDWVSYAGTGKNVLGAAILCGHGRPGPIRLVPPDLLDAHVLQLDDAGKRGFYDLLASGDKERIREETERIPLSIMFREETGAPNPTDRTDAASDPEGREE